MLGQLSSTHSFFSEKTRPQNVGGGIGKVPESCWEPREGDLESNDWLQDQLYYYPLKKPKDDEPEKCIRTELEEIFLHHIFYHDRNYNIENIYLTVYWVSIASPNL